MILYVNGDSHTAAAEAVNAHAFAEDDPKLVHLHRLPHPDNLAVSWGRLLSNTTKSVFKCDAESASSNDRILRTSRAWLEANQAQLYRTLMIIQWSTWEREEWLHNGTYYQVNASGIDIVPPELADRYKEYVATVNWAEKTQQAHDKIWQFHEELMDMGVPHVFFNGNSHFGQVPKRSWGPNYISPYDAEKTFSATLTQNGHQTVAPNSYHFGKDAHRFWANFMLQYCMNNQFL